MSSQWWKDVCCVVSVRETSKAEYAMRQGDIISSGFSIYSKTVEIRLCTKWKVIPILLYIYAHGKFSLEFLSILNVLWYSQIH